MSEVRVKIKVGVVEVEVEGAEAFVLDKFPNLLSNVLKENGWANNKEIITAGAVQSSGTGAVATGALLEHSTNTIASIMNAKTGPDLAMAACAHLSLVKGQAKFSRKDVLDEMQSAAAYYNQNYSGNLTKILQSLMKAKKLNLVANQTYSLPKSQIEFFQDLMMEE